MNRRSFCAALLSVFGLGALTRPAARPDTSWARFHLHPCNIRFPLTKDQLAKLGRKGPYHRYATFPLLYGAA